MIKTINSNKESKQISIIGAGIAGCSTAFQLAIIGYQVTLIDPNMRYNFDRLGVLNGTGASLGILMGNLFKRSKGRSWQLRKRSMELWPIWIAKLKELNNNLHIKQPLIRLASSEKEYKFMIELYNQKKDFGLKLLEKESIDFWSNIFENKQYGGIVSLQDGRINPIECIEAMMQALDKLKIKKITDPVVSIKKGINVINKRWIINFQNTASQEQDSIIICSGLNSQSLIKPLGYDLKLEPILGQVLDLKLKNKNSDWEQWPAVINKMGMNFIHYESNKILMGATIEEAKKPCKKIRDEMYNMNNSAPTWLKQSSIISHWSGIRAKPKKEPSPILKRLEAGLLINSGHFRNGILLAPACAEWIAINL